ncbi:MAG: FtsW/RodA/SpoVE family cell cycle protein [Alphaproteobacteria bacterium]|jgi:cell division protein FtsW|nr:FtsW/RodA/SpoVE family cell cycle protein [Alphaproteobacteria bacterium]
MSFEIESIDIRDKMKEKLLSFDKGLLIPVIALMVIGFLMAFSAFPYNAQRIGANGFALTKKYLIYAFVSCIVMAIFSFSNQRRIKSLGIIGFIGTLALLVSVFFIGTTIKGGTRWIDIGITTIQPSELLKPFYIIVNAILLVRFKKNMKKNRTLQARKLGVLILALFGFIAGNIIIQPDLGMTLVFFVIFASQVFIAGFPWKYVIGFAGIGVGMIFLAYNTLPHVHKRINTFLYPEQSDTYQIDSALRTIKASGFFSSPGNILKKNVPDVHTDFILAAIFENLGIIGGVGVLCLILWIVIKGFKVCKKRLIDDDFALFVAFPMIILFLTQCLINIGGTLRLIPSKGATLPFVSYGGSSYLCFAVVFGVLISLTRKYNF